MTETDDPRAQFRQLPDPIHPEELVETVDVGRPVDTEQPLEAEWRQAMLGPGTP